MTEKGTRCIAYLIKSHQPWHPHEWVVNAMETGLASPAWKGMAADQTTLYIIKNMGNRHG